MLQKTNPEAAHCYARAAENRRMAERGDPKLREDYLDMEERWLKLALSYEFTDRLNQFTAQVTCAMDKKTR